MIHAVSSAILSLALALTPAAAAIGSGVAGSGTLPAGTDATAAGCTITNAAIEWGFKESFRSYISGTIAHGDWTVRDGAAYETPTFRWSDGAGAFSEGEGTIDFTGAVTFTGHGGILNTTIANPRVRITDADTAVLLVDVSGTTQQGDPVDAPQTELVELALSEATHETAGERVTFTAVPAVLTTSGAAAFGTYEAGTAMDPLTLRYETPEGCAPAAPVGLKWLSWLIGAVALACLVVVGMIMRRRRLRRLQA